MNFSNAAKDLDSIYEIVAFLNDLPISRLPQDAINQLDSSLKAVLNWLTRINKFSLDQGSPAQARDEIVANIAAAQQDLYRHAHVWIPFLAYLRGDIPNHLKAISGSVTAASSQADEFAKYLASQKLEIESIISATREASADAGVGHFTQDFSNDSVEREEDAKKWLIASACFAAASLLSAAAFLFSEPATSAIELVQVTTSKVVLLGVLIAATAWCAGVYKANKHQSTVSRHKAHSLKTFRAFVSATDDESVRDAVLIETTRAIFSHGASGYISSEPGGEGSSKVIEIIKAAADRA
jgi:hypothetical protein